MNTRSRKCPRRRRLIRAGEAVSLVPLTKGRYALVDSADAVAVGRHNWHLNTSPTRVTPYAATNVTGPDGRQRTVKLHQFLWRRWRRPACPKIDHANRDGLDCRSGNLRAAKTSQNNANVGVRSDNTSGYKGVCWEERAGRWRAKISVERRRISLGYHDDAEAAARAYDAAARQHFGAFAYTNFPISNVEAPIFRKCRAT